MLGLLFRDLFGERRSRRLLARARSAFAAGDLAAGEALLGLVEGPR